MLGNIFHFHPKNNNSNKEPQRQTKFKDVVCSINLKFKKQKDEAKGRQNPQSDEETKENKSFHQDENDENSNHMIEQRDLQQGREVGEDASYLRIKNIATGEEFELNQSPLEITGSNSIYENIALKGVPWHQFWKNVRKSNEKLWDAAEEGEEAKVLEILDSTIQAYPAEIDSKALDNWTALHMAVNYGHINVVQALLRKNASVEAETSMLRTPLHLSCLRGHLEIAKLLLDYGANVNAQDNERNSPMHYACENGFADVVTYLLNSADPDITMKNTYSMTCLDLTTSLEIKRIFESRGLINERTFSSFGRTCFDDVILYNSRTDLIGKLLHMDSYRQKIIQAKTNHANRELEKQLQVTTVGPDDFIRHDILGKGSFGEVYLVEKISTGKLYAMKVLKKDRIRDQNLTKYAKIERNILTRIDHPFVVKLDSAFQTDTKLYLILQYCPGGDLGNLIAKKKRLSEGDARVYIAEIVLALEVLHQNDILYRDLKPDNVILDEEGHALLTDFGLSKEDASQTGLAQSFCGSIAYLPPEMLTRAGHNKTVDWYLLGVLLYEMLVGIPPYFSTQREQLFENILRGTLKLPKSLSLEAQHLLIMLLKRDPTKRLGAKRDAKDIKNHPWFSRMNWEDVYNRKLRPPSIEIKPPQLHKLTNPKVEDNHQKTSSGQSHIPDWSFVHP